MDLILENNDTLAYLIYYIETNYKRIESNLILYNLSKTNSIIRKEIMKYHHPRELVICYIDNYLTNKIKKQINSLENTFINLKYRSNLLSNVSSDNKQIYINFRTETIHDKNCGCISMINLKENTEYLSRFLNKFNLDNDNEEISIRISTYNYLKKYDYFKNFYICRNSRQCKLLNRFLLKELDNIRMLTI